MSWKEYPQLDEKLFTRRLSNGLTVKVVPKPGFSRGIAYFATDFGSLHTDFILDGKRYHVPVGIAHFLEHKLFEMPQGDVTPKFAALGGRVNAFTSFDMTAYYFSCTNHLMENLRLLLEFVSTPYFTQESVEREWGIIDQEIAMNEDDPGSREFFALMDRMYRHHPVRLEVLGSRESIRQITAQTLYDCHRAFYTPANMVLCVVGDVDAEAVAALAEEILGTEYRAPGEKIRNWPEEMTCDNEPALLRQDVAIPSYQLGFKCEAPERGEATVRADITGYLAAEILFGEASPLYLRLYESGVIDSSFGGGFETIDGCAMLTCGGDGDRGEEIRQALLAEAARIRDEGVREEDLLRLKRGAMGRRIRDLVNFDAICYRLCAYHFLNFDYFRFPAVYAGVTAEDVRSLLARIITEERCAMAITRPLENQ